MLGSRESLQGSLRLARRPFLKRQTLHAKRRHCRPLGDKFSMRLEHEDDEGRKLFIILHVAYLLCPLRVWTLEGVGLRAAHSFTYQYEVYEALTPPLAGPLFTADLFPSQNWPMAFGTSISAISRTKHQRWNSATNHGIHYRHRRVANLQHCGLQIQHHFSRQVV